MEPISPVRQQYLKKLMDELNTGKWGEVLELFLDEPCEDPPGSSRDFQWRPVAFTRLDGRILVLIAPQYDHWWKRTSHNTIQEAYAESMFLRPWDLRLNPDEIGVVEPKLERNRR